MIYVDDILIATPNRAMMGSIKAKINSKFPITDNGPLTFWLNMHFIRKRDKRTISIHQEPKIAKLLSDERLTAADRLTVSKPCKIPASSELMLTKDMSPITDVEKKRMELFPYKSMLRSQSFTI